MLRISGLLTFEHFSTLPSNHLTPAKPYASPRAGIANVGLFEHSLDEPLLYC